MARVFPRKPRKGNEVIVWGDELWNDNELYIPFLESNSQISKMDLTDYGWGRRDGTMNGGSAQAYDGMTGPGWERTATNTDRIEFGQDNTFVPTGSNCTILWLGLKTDATDRNSYAFGCVTPSATHYCHSLQPWSDGTIYWDYGGTGSGNRVSVASPDLSQLTAMIYTVGSRGMEIWANGELLAVNTGASSATRTQSNTQYALGAGNTGAVNGDLVGVECFGMWSRQLSYQEIARLTDDPFTLLRGKRGRRKSLVGRRARNDGTVAFAVPILTFSVTGTKKETATVDIDIPVLELSATGTASPAPVSGSVGISVPVLTMSWTGTVKETASVAIDIPVLSFAVPAAVVYSPITITGTIGFSIPIPEIGVSAYHPDIAGSVSMSMPLPVLWAASPNDLVGSPVGPATDGGGGAGTNWEWMVDNMTWEGLQLLDGISRVKGPPNARTTDVFWEAFKTSTTGKCMHVIIRQRLPSAADAAGAIPGEVVAVDYLDFWFTHYWGHTDWTDADDPTNYACFWDDVAADPLAQSVTIGVTPFFDFGLYTPQARDGSARVGHGQAMQGRTRLTFLSLQAFSTGPVVNDTNPGHSLPFYNEILPPSNVTDKAATLAETISGDDGYPRYAPLTAPTGTKQFEGNPACYPSPSRSGDQGRFGMNHLAVDIWAEPTGDANGTSSREQSWYDRLSTQANYTGNFVQPDGSFWDTNDSRWDQLTADANGDFHQNSYGYATQAWFQPQRSEMKALGLEYDWMNADHTDTASNPSRWTREPRSHHGNTHLAQYVERHSDPGIWRLLQHTKAYVMGQENLSNRGTDNYKPGHFRSRGRALMSLVSIYLLDTTDTALKTHIVGLVDLYLEHQDTYDFPTNGDPNAVRRESTASQTVYSPWEAALFVAGLNFVSVVDMTDGDPLVGGLTRIQRVGLLSVQLVKFVLACSGDDGGTRRIHYTCEKDGTPSTNGNAGDFSSGLSPWCVYALMVAHYHLRPSLTAGETTELDFWIADYDTNLTTGATTWSDVTNYHYRPSSATKTAECSFLIPTPQVSIPDGAGVITRPDGTVLGNLAISIPVLGLSVTATNDTVQGTVGTLIPRLQFSMTSNATTAVTGTVGITSPVLVLSVPDGAGTVTSPPGVKTGALNISIALPVLGATTAVIPPLGQATASLTLSMPVPTFIPMINRSGQVLITWTNTIPVPQITAGNPFGSVDATFGTSIPLLVFAARAPANATQRELPALSGFGVSQLSTLLGASVTIENLTIRVVRGDDIRQPFLVSLDQGRALDGTETWKFVVRARKSDTTTRMSLTSPTGIEVDSETNQPSAIFTPAVMPESAFPYSQRDRYYAWDLEMFKDSKYETVSAGDMIVVTDVSR